VTKSDEGGNRNGELRGQEEGEVDQACKGNCTITESV